MRFFFIILTICFGLALSFLSFSELETYNFIDFLSLFIYIFTLTISLLNYKYFIFFLFFNMIAMPTAINNFIPGVSLGLDYELGAATIPLFTFFDLFCILGIIRYKLIANFNKTYIKVLLITCSCVFLFHMLSSVNFQNLLLS